jgi:hypothetical protein
MKSLLLIPFLLKQPDVVVLSKPYMMLVSETQNTPVPLADDFCEELKYNYINEKTELRNFTSRLNFLKKELKKIYSGQYSELTESEVLQQLSENNNAIKTVMTKLNYLADVKFTSEIYQLNINWSLPVFKQHHEDEYNKIKDLLGLGGFRALSPWEKDVYRAGKPFTQRSYDLNYFYYSGEESKDLHHDFYVNRANKFNGIVQNKDVHKFIIFKKSSKLEICQFMPTLEIGLEIIETVKHDLGFTTSTTKQLYLKFEETL